MIERATPYDTGKVKIGLLYQPKQKIEFSNDQELLQRALLGERDQHHADLLLALACLFAIACICGGMWYAGA